MEIFVDPESEITHITGPLIAFMKSAGHTIRFEISHLPLEVQRARLLGIRFQMPAAMGILKEKELSKPVTVLLVPRTEFTVPLPTPASIHEVTIKKIRRNVEMAALEVITAATLAGVFMGLASEVGYRIDLFSSNLFLIDGEFTLKKAGITGGKDMTIGIGIVVHLMTSAAFGVLYLILTRLFSLYTSSPKIIFLYVFFLWLAMLFIALPIAGQGVLGRSIGKSVWLEQLILHAIFGFGFWWALNTI